MRNSTITFWTIVVLLLLLLPMTIYGTSMHIKNAQPVIENPNHAFKYEGKLYFYDGNTLLGTYACQGNVANCDISSSSDNYPYSLNEKKIEKNSRLPVIANRYVFIKDLDADKENILFYDLTLKQVLKKYKEIKNYGIGIANNYYILKDTDDFYGVLAINNDFRLLLPFQYNYIGLTNKMDSEEDKIASDIFAVLQNGKWTLIDINGATFTEPMQSEIFSYNSEYVVLKDNMTNTMQLVDYSNNILFNNFKYIDFYNKYVLFMDNFNNFYLYDMNERARVSNTYSISSIEDVELKLENNEIQIYIKGKKEQSIAIE